MLFRWGIGGLLALHGLIHLMGFAKSVGLAELPQLTQSISRAWGLAWLAAAALVVASAATFALGARQFWLVGALALLASQFVIGSAWRDAWAGSIANALLLVLVAHGWLTEGPWSFRAAFISDAETGLARPIDAPVVTEADLEPLPVPVQRYLRRTGVVGRPRVRNYRMRFRGRIRSAPDSAWMPFEAEQQSFADAPTRLFLMRARMFGLPVEAWHRSVGGHATMRVKVAGLLTMVDASGEVMDRSEAVTLFNDMCLLAPATLLDAAIRWEPVDATIVRAHFTNSGQRITSDLTFDDAGDLTNFISDDRSRSSPDGTQFTRLRFSTPVRGYRDFGAARLAAHGEARWLLPEGEFTYGEFDLVEVAYNVRP